MARVLIVDDYPGGAESLAMLLRSAGHACLALSDGAEALETMDQFQPDVVISDLFMPGVSGFDLARTIRAMRAWREVVLIAMTSYDSHFKRTATEAGFDRYLTKPIEFAELAAMLDGLGASRSDALVR